MRRQHKQGAEAVMRAGFHWICFPPTFIAVAPVPALFPAAETALGISLEFCRDGLAGQWPSSTELLNTALPCSYRQTSVPLLSATNSTWADKKKASALPRWKFKISVERFSWPVYPETIGGTQNTHKRLAKPNTIKPAHSFLDMQTLFYFLPQTSE